MLVVELLTVSKVVVFVILYSLSLGSARDIKTISTHLLVSFSVSRVCCFEGNLQTGVGVRLGSDNELIKC